MPSEKIDRLLFAAMLWLGLLVLIASDDTKFGWRGPPRPELTQDDLGATVRSSDLSWVNSVIRYFVPLAQALDHSKRKNTEEQARLGQRLFFDRRLSKSQTISCNSCHTLSNYGVDGLDVSIGHEGQRGRRNAPSVLNTGGQFLFFWDGRARSLEDQARHPIFSRIEMAMDSEQQLLSRLSSVGEYRAAFAAAFPDAARGIRMEHVLRALAAFERRLITPSRWDRFVVGYSDELSKLEKQGFARFVGLGCISCHNGSLFGGGNFERLGVVEPWPNQADSGRAEVTHKTRDRMYFKVPSLRNVAKTAPYFHDASADTLAQAVRMMARHQMGRELSDADVRALTAWLGTLTGELPEQWTDAPELR